MDALGDEHLFVEKVPVVTRVHLDAASSYPQGGVIACIVLGRSEHGDGRQLVHIDTQTPWGIESTEGKDRFDVFAEQLRELNSQEGSNDPVPSVFDLPERHWLRTAHKRSIRHRAEIEASTVCGCFYCQETFDPSEIEDWTDTRNPVSEQTALCPRCGIDSVIGDKSGFAITPEFLAEMNKAWF